jgi:YVTN family beta-propeller protein
LQPRKQSGFTHPGECTMLSHRICRLSAWISLPVFAFAGLAAAAPKAYVGNFKDNTVSVIDTGTRKVLGTIPVAAGPHGMAMTPDGRRLYVTGDESSSMSVIDTSADRVIRTIDVGKEPHGVTLAPDARLLLVAVNGEDQVVFVDTASQSVVGKVRVLKPHTIAIRRDGKFAYVASQQPGQFALAVIDLASRSLARSIALDKPPRDLEFGYDGKALYFTEAGLNAVQVLDPSSDKIIASIPTGASPHYANFFPKTALGMAVVQGPGEVLLFDPSSNTPARSIKVGKQPHWLTTSSDGKTAFVTDEGSNDLSIVDLASGRIETIPVGNAPRKVAVQPAPAPGKVSISNFSFLPAVIKIEAGQSVVWSNDDGGPHAIAYRDGGAGAKSLLPGETFTRVFDRPGSYEYICSFHSFMTGRVEVSGAGSEDKL